MSGDQNLANLRLGMPVEAPARAIGEKWCNLDLEQMRIDWACG
jgi:hypothetical protein